MKNKGYTIIEAVIAMFLVVVMVGAVFSSLMAGRRAIVTSSEREDVLYSMQSLYTMIKDCRNNNGCLLRSLGCTDIDNLKNCEGLFTFSFQNVCKNAEDDGKSNLSYDVVAVSGVQGGVLYYGQTSNEDPSETNISSHLGKLDIVSFCDEQ